MNRWNILPALAVLLWGGCESAFVIDSDGIIEIAIRTRGSDPDAGGYSLIVDGRMYALPSTGTLSLQLPPGGHRVEVVGLAENCLVDGANPRTVTVGGGMAGVSIVVVCA